MKSYERHVFVCLGQRCLDKGSELLLDILKEKIRTSGIRDRIRLSRTGCLKPCKEAEPEGANSPILVVYPEGVWYSNVTEADVDDIIERHLKRGEVVDRLVCFDNSACC